MTGQVKEEVLSRFGELGLRVRAGAVHFQPDLLRAREFIPHPLEFRYLDVDGNWQTIKVPDSGLAFTWCQVPIVYQLADVSEPVLEIKWNDGRQARSRQLVLSKDDSNELFQRGGHIRQLTVTLGKSLLFAE